MNSYVECNTDVVTFMAWYVRNDWNLKCCIHIGTIEEKNCSNEIVDDMLGVVAVQRPYCSVSDINEKEYYGSVCYGHARTDLQESIKAIAKKHCTNIENCAVHLHAEKIQEAKSPKEDRQCIFTVNDCTNHGCRIERCSNSSFESGFNANAAPAYVVKLKTDKSKIVGNICHNHAVAFKHSCRVIADYAGCDMDDLHIEVHWNSSGYTPNVLNETNWRLQYELNPNWVKGDHVCDKWKMKRGNIGTCRFCNGKYFVPFSENLLKSDDPEFLNVGLYCCKSCQDKKQQLGCGKCGCKIVQNSYPNEFDWRYNTRYYCNDCWSCERCGDKFKTWSDYEKAYPDDSNIENYREFSKKFRSLSTGSDYRICQTCANKDHGRR